MTSIGRRPRKAGIVRDRNQRRAASGSSGHSRSASCLVRASTANHPPSALSGSGRAPSRSHRTTVLRLTPSVFPKASCESPDHSRRPPTCFGRRRTAERTPGTSTADPAPCIMRNRCTVASLLCQMTQSTSMANVGVNLPGGALGAHTDEEKQRHFPLICTQSFTFGYCRRARLPVQYCGSSSLRARPKAPGRSPPFSGRAPILSVPQKRGGNALTT